jgi:predicted DNA-binding protein
MYKTMTDIKKPIPPFMFRLRPEYRKLLDQTSDLERRSRASILEELIKKHLPQRVKEGSEDLHDTK